MSFIGYLEQLEEIKKGTVEILPEDELIKKLKASQENNLPLRVKVGFDPTTPDLHLGHTVLLQKLRSFQKLGHHIALLIGDFTGTIGDPSGRSETRVGKSYEEVLENAKTYRDQIFNLLDLESTEVVYNSEWINKMTPKEIFSLCSCYTVSRMLERDDFQKRFSSGRPISIHEFLYPLLQGYDSAILRSDIELGGTDQKFNLLVGRDIQRNFGQEPQVIITMPLLEGLDGKNKMSKSLGNYIGIFESPKEMFGKLMSISDDLMIRYYELLSNISLEEFQSLKTRLTKGEENPRDAKIKLALEIVERFHSKEKANEALKEFREIFQEKKTPADIEIEEISWDKEKIWLPSLLTRIGFSTSNQDAKRLILQGGLYLNGERIKNVDTEIEAKGQYLIKAGKKRFKKVSFGNK